MSSKIKRNIRKIQKNAFLEIKKTKNATFLLGKSFLIRFKDMVLRKAKAFVQSFMSFLTEFLSVISNVISNVKGVAEKLFNTFKEKTKYKEINDGSVKKVLNAPLINEDKENTGETPLDMLLNIKKELTPENLIKAKDKIKEASGAEAREIRDIIYALKEHPLFKDVFDSFPEVSDDIGTPYVNYFADQTALDPEFWVQAIPIRYNLKTKLNQNTQDMILNTYSKLNAMHTLNFSNEYWQGIKYVNRNPLTFMYLKAPDKTCLGDMFWSLYLTQATSTSIRTLIKTLIQLQFKENMKLIDSLYPIQKQEKYENSISETTIEKTALVIDNKGNKISNLDVNIPNNDILY